MRLILIAVLGGLLLANSAAAQSSQNPLDTRIFKNGWWVGGGVGWSDLDADDITLDDDDFGFNVGIGYQFLNYFGANVRYRNLGEFSDQINPGSGDVDVDVDGWSAGLSAGYPITQRIAPVIGLGYYDFDFDAGSGIEDNDSQGIYVSGGIATQIGRVVIQPNLIWYDVDDYDLYGVEVNVFWKFEAGN
ncbi:MAG: outer membrane beta-barrel protein [Chromatiales bacterium]|nr:MAG: outer membrane beta-barrel protein [Chromatiales bacterium]